VSEPLVEPVVRIRCAPEDEARTRAALSRAGLAAERSLLHLVVRDADPDVVDEALASGGARSRTVVRERIVALLGWLLDHAGQVAGREAAMQRLVERVVEEGGLAARHAARPAAELREQVAGLHERLLATGAAFVPWRDFVATCCRDGR
jgi:hypothetical protein